MVEATQGSPPFKGVLEVCAWSADVEPLQRVVLTQLSRLRRSANPKHVRQLVSISVFSFPHLLLAVDKSEITCVNLDFSFLIMSDHLSLEMVSPNMTAVIFHRTLPILADSVFGTWTQQVKGPSSSGTQMGVLLGHPPEQPTQTCCSLA